MQGGRMRGQGTSLYRPPLRVALNDRWSLRRVKYILACKDSANKLRWCSLCVRYFPTYVYIKGFIVYQFDSS